MYITTDAPAKEVGAEHCPPDHLNLTRGFDPRQYPILARHWPDLREYTAPANRNDARALKHVGPVAAEIVAHIRFRQFFERLHRLGPRAVGELLAEVGAERGIGSIVDQKLERYAELDPEAVAATGGGDFWPAPLTKAQP